MQPPRRLRRDMVTVHGTPQIIYKIPLEDVPEEGLIGLNLASLLDQIIIGPTEYPMPMAEAFINVMITVGIEDASSRVTISDLPLRHTA